MEADQQKIQSLSEALQKVQDDLQGSISALQTLQSQLAENKAVQKEFKSLTTDANIYKLVGPVLLKQDKIEATNAVEGRLDFIGKEVTRTENRIKGLQVESDKKRRELIAIQQKIQMTAQERRELG